MTRIRPFTAADVPAVAELSVKAFHWSRPARPEQREAGIRAVFVDSPFVSAEIPCLVLENDRGQVVGFKGVWARRALFERESLMAAIGAQLMVAPEHRGTGAGLALLREGLNGPQDFTWADTSNHAARRLYDRSGGTTSLADSIAWVRPLRPLRFALARAAPSPSTHFALVLVRPLLAPFDRVLARWPRGTTLYVPSPASESSLLTAPEYALRLSTQAENPHRLTLEYDVAGMTWLLEMLRRASVGDAVRYTDVRDESGRHLGSYVRYAAHGGTSQVLHVGGTDETHGLVLDRLIADAHAEGAVAVSGRVHAGRMADYADRGCRFEHTGPWVAFHSRRHEIVDAVLRGGSLLSRLDGEWPVTVIREIATAS